MSRKILSVFALTIFLTGALVLIEDLSVDAAMSVKGVVDEWPMSHHDEQNTEYSLDTIVFPPLTKLWEHDLMNFAGRPVASHEAVFVVRWDGVVLKLNAGDGSIVWEKNLGYYISGLALGQDLVFVSMLNGTFLALNENNGDLEWTFTGTQGQRFWTSSLYRWDRLRWI